MLTATEQTLLCCLSVFRDSFSLNSAIKIANGIGIDISGATEAIASLVDKSLVVVTEGTSETSYRLLNTTRNYAALKLKESNLGPDVQRQHALLMSEILVATEQKLQTMGKSLVDWCHENSRRIDDIRAALEWSFSETGDGLIGADLVLASAPLWFQFMLLNEYIGWLDVTSAHGATICSSPSMRIRLKLAIGNAYLYTRGSQPETFALLNETVALANEFNDLPSALKATWALYTCYNMMGDYQNSLVQARKYGALAQRSHERATELTYHRMMGLSYHLNGEQELARRHVMKALVPQPEASPTLQGSAYQIDHQTACLTQLARILWIQGIPEQALQTAAEAVEYAQAINHAFSLAYALAYAACLVSLWAGEMNLASTYVRRLHTCATEHSWQYWQSWANIYTQLLALKKDDGNTISDHRQMPFFDDTPLNDGLADTIATIAPGFVGKKAIARVENGKNGWSAAEIHRVLGERALADDTTEAESLFLHSIDLARMQGAQFWLLRAAISLARLYESQKRHQEARVILTDALEKYGDNESIADICTARALLLRLNASSL